MRGSLFNHSRLLLIEAAQLTVSRVKMQNVTCLFLNHQDRCENNRSNWHGRFTLCVYFYKITSNCVKYLVIIVRDIIIDTLAVVLFY